MRSRWLDMLDAIPNWFMLLLYVFGILSVVRECYTRKDLGRSVQGLTHRTQRLEDRVSQIPQVGPWRIHIVPIGDTVYACRHPGWSRDSLWPKRLPEIQPGAVSLTRGK